MKLGLSDLEAFVAVAEFASFRAAAESINLSQPALSRRIEKLEEALGVRLFDRDTRNVDLTTVGRDFARKARTVLADLDSILLGVRDVAANRWGHVTLACIPSTVHYFLPSVLRRYHERFPRIRVRIIDDSANEVLSAVLLARPSSVSTSWAVTSRRSSSSRCSPNRSSRRVVATIRLRASAR